MTKMQRAVNPKKVFFGQNVTKSPYFEGEKMVEIVRFRP